MRRSLAAVRRLRQNPNLYRAATYSSAPTPSPRVSAIVDEISSLTLLEASSLSSALQSRLGVDQLPIFALLFPGSTPSFASGSAGAASAAAEEKKEEKTSFDLKLESFEAANKIKVIKEVRAFTDLGLKEAKELVEKAPMVIKKGVTKEEAEKIVEKMKEIGAKVMLE
jgi:large subunit ribosomal protein L7/L12